jgi:Raf kinase inhibitor-like YbhB/YbcL family protein
MKFAAQFQSESEIVNLKLFLMATKTQTLTIRSLVFSQDGHIPKKYSCEGENINPPLEISNIPEEAQTLALIAEDPDAPRGTFYHWLVWNIPPNEPIAEGYVPGISGKNSFGKTGYGGPCPPSGEHRYFFKFYALDTELDLQADADKNALEQAMHGHIIAQGELMGKYRKSGT